MSAGRMNRKLSWQRRELISDGAGNSEGEWEEIFVRWAQIKPSLGLETVTAARLAGQQPVDIIVYRDSETRSIEADWRAVDVNEGTKYSLTSPSIDLAQDRKYLTVKAVAQ